MKLLNTFRKTARIWNDLGFLFVGLLFVALSLLILLSPNDAVYEPVNATVVDIQESYNLARENYEYQVLVDYEVNGVAYTHIPYPSYHTGMKAGDIVEGLYNTEDPSDLQAPDSRFIPYITLTVGLIVTVISFIMLIKNIRRPADALEEYNKVDVSQVPAEVIESIRNNTEPTTRYYFHYDKTFFKQGHLLEDAQHRTIYEIKLVKYGWLGPHTFDFVNHLTGHTVTYHIGRPVSTSIGVGGQFVSQVPISSSFKIDGEKNWDFLSRQGYGFNCHLKGLAPCFDVLHYGEPVAYIETVGTGLFEDVEIKNPLAKIPANGYYRIDCRQEDLDAVMMICYSINKSIFYQS